MLSIIYVGWSICYILYRLLYLIYHWCIVVFLWSSFELDIICSRHAPYCLTCVLHSSYSLKMYKMVIVVLDRACFLNLRQKIFETFCDFATLLETLFQVHVVLRTWPVRLCSSISFRQLVLTKTKGCRKLRGLDFSISCSLALKIHSALNSTNAYRK